MTRDEFISRVKEELNQMLPEELTKDLDIQETVVLKSNDQKHHGLTFKRGESEAAPTIYLDDSYARFTEGEDLHTLTAELKDAYLGSLSLPEPQKVDFDYDRIKDNLTVRLLEIRRNRDFLATTPYMTVGHGLAMVCDIKMDDGDKGSWRATVTQGMLESQNYDKRELFMAAMDNAQLIDPPVLVDMNQALFAHEGENLMKRGEPLPPEDVSSMYILSNTAGMLGSAALFYPDTREHIAEVIGESYTVLPSSQHEVLIIPDSAGIPREDLAGMVKTANEIVVEPKDVLSDNIFHYDRDEKKFELATPQAEKGAIVAESGRC
ncbi:MAG: hypothetical protein E7221_06720 [Clostridiales bacterium]|nr:hypothetical protein [Clostridiales bacterium]